MCNEAVQVLSAVKGAKESIRRPKETWLPDIGGEVATDERGVSSMQAGMVVMKPKLSPRDELVGTVVLAVFTAVWILGAFPVVVQPILDWQIGEASLGLYEVSRMILYVLSVLIIIGCLFYCFMSLFNPRLTLTLSSGSVPLGGVILLKWTVTGRSSVMRQLTITLYGREYATYEDMETADSNQRQLGDKKGTDEDENTLCRENTFSQMEVFSTQDGREIRSGEVGLVMPSDTMHSFEAYWNKIVWDIEVHGAIKLWPDVKETFKIAVLPAEMDKA
jgi:hypothetical protein